MPAIGPVASPIMARTGSAEVAAITPKAVPSAPRKKAPSMAPPARFNAARLTSSSTRKIAPGITAAKIGS